MEGFQEEVAAKQNMLMQGNAIIVVSMSQVNVVSMRQDIQLSMEQMQDLTDQVKEEEILQDLKGINDLTVPRTDGYGAKFFKATCGFTKNDVINAITEFFDKDQMCCQ